ncbi:MAG: hypothetical protein KAH14_01645 [Clostridiales bacterium]|nr:hypothetical protein [Clostridiales bacterium]
MREKVSDHPSISSPNNSIAVMNKNRIHSSLGYLTPKEYRIVTLKKNV